MGDDLERRAEAPRGKLTRCKGAPRIAGEVRVTRAASVVSAERRECLPDPLDATRRRIAMPCRKVCCVVQLTLTSRVIYSPPFRTPGAPARHSRRARST